jgi:hypothetical protein
MIPPTGKSVESLTLVPVHRPTGPPPPLLYDIQARGNIYIYIYIYICFLTISKEGHAHQGRLERRRTGLRAVIISPSLLCFVDY